jgi:pilus assembly protein Flp/PilA
MLKSLKNVLTNEDGATLVEYGMLVALIAAVSIAVVKLIGAQILTAFTTVNKAL